MNTTDEYRLSFYRDFGDLDAAGHARIVRHVESGNLYVRKELENYDLSVFRALHQNHFGGVPAISELVEDAESNKLIVIEEFINGQTLRNILEHKGTLPADQAASVLTAICDVLAQLNSNVPPIIHRDIKPENVVITDDSELYIVDFDASKTYRTGKDRDTELIGTRKYAAPEQYGFSQSDPRTDVYAVGRVGIEMITGDPGTKISSLGDPVFRILERCIEMDPKNRFQSVGELSAALSRIFSTPAVDGGKQAARKAGPYPGGTPAGRAANIESGGYENERVAGPYPGGTAAGRAANIGSGGYENERIAGPYPGGTPAGKNADRKENIRRIHYNSFALPGFRTDTPWKASVACVGYSTMLGLAIYYFMKDDSDYGMKFKIAYSAAIFLILFGWSLLFNDYHGVAQRLPLTRSRNIILRIIGYYIYMMAVVMIISVILSLAGINV